MTSSPPPNAPLILEAQANFALNLLCGVSTEDRSCIVSPFSVAVTLSMVYAGAKGKTAEELGELLGNGVPESEVHQYFGTLLKSIANGQNISILETGNKVYVNKGFRVKSAFKEQIEENYGGQMETVDFKDSEGTAELDMMHLTANFFYFEDPELQFLGMPYKGEKEFMFVLLPKKRFGLTKLLAQLDGKKLVELIKKRDKCKVKVQLPRFTLEATHELNEPLTNMGMPTAFTDNANFEGISGKKPLLISKVVQKAFIEVNEKGTVAAAVTKGCVRYGASKEERFVADHPFCAFLIRDDTVLFSAIFRK
ncbi:hypothetical protein niasHT_022916 [Heterodera trifolii]|uniref:Serpin domain-containing protein n=1 Tax=Heterodera trifolii TaxID=157864 RepID=A0ABD2JYG5_9BILA